MVLERATEDLPPKTKEIPPHPHGIELGTLMQMMKETKSYKLSAFLEEEFVRVSARVAMEICESAGLDPEVKPKSLVLGQAKALHEAMQSAKLMSPPTDCLGPIFFFFKQKTAYEVGLGIPAEPLFRSRAEGVM